MGEVYKARDRRLDRLVAVKVAQERLSERFAREAQTVAARNHPNICQLYDIGPDYMLMELVEGAPKSVFLNAKASFYRAER
jgi:serine/threonine protein kinase